MTRFFTNCNLITASFVIPLFPSIIHRFQTTTSAVSGDYQTPRSQLLTKLQSSPSTAVAAFLKTEEEGRK